MKRKVLIVSSVASMIDQFNRNNINILQGLGYKVHIATNFDYPGTISREKTKELISDLEEKDINYFQIDFSRNPFNIKNNIKAYNQIRSLLKENNYKIVHLHSPVGAAIGRLALQAKNEDTKVIYTAHGFHFFKGAPIKNWLLYYTVEKILARKTDVLITINEEDYATAKTKKLGKKVELIPGIGVDIKKFTNLERSKSMIISNNIELKETDFVAICIGELNKNKNQLFLLEVIDQVRKSIPNIKLLLVGEGENRKDLEKKIVDLGLQDYVFLLGFRKDIQFILSLSDVLFSVSYREGLPVNVIEGMAMGLPIIASSCRGNVDLIENGVNGFILDNYDSSEYSNKLERLYLDKELYKEMSLNNRIKSINYSIDSVQKIMKDIYLERN